MDKSKSICELNDEFTLERHLESSHISYDVIKRSEKERIFDLHASHKNHSVKYIDQNSTDVIRPLKDILTDLIVSEFFQTKDTLYTFLKTVYTTFFHELEKYRKKRKIDEFRVFFLYKGGNILRIVSNEFLLELPGSSIREISEFYEPYFKRSDADFSIYIDPDLENYEDIYYEIGLLSYLIQDKIRDWFSDHLMKYFNFFRYNLEYQKDILKLYLNKLNKVEEFNGQFIDLKIGNVAAVGENEFTYSNNSDVTLEFVDEKEDWSTPVRKAAKAVIKKEDSLMTITHNNSLDFKAGTENIRIKFNLTRTKFIFTLLKKDGHTMNIGGELIDVSIGHRNDVKISYFWENPNDNVVTYDLSFTINCRFMFYSYSLLYLIHDLEDILFNQQRVPWGDIKYVKRLNRLFYLYFIDIFIILENGVEKLKIMEDIVDIVFIPIKLLVQKDSQSWNNSIDRFKKEYEHKELMIINLIDRLKNISLNLTIEDKIPFIEMMNVLIDNAQIIIDSIINIRNYCSIDGFVEFNDLYEANMKRLI